MVVDETMADSSSGGVFASVLSMLLCAANPVGLVIRTAVRRPDASVRVDG